MSTKLPFLIFAVCASLPLSRVQTAFYINIYSFILAVGI